MSHVLGIDIGGTNTKIMVMDGLGAVVYNSSVLTVAGKPQETLGGLAGEAKSALGQLGLDRIEAVGITVPGPTNSETGTAYFVPNLDWHNVDVRSFFENQFDCPVSIENDGNANLLGEWRFGAGKGYDDIILLALGTGLGGGILSNGLLVHGASCLAGEVGHMIVGESEEICSCGKTGCLESFCSGRAILRDARKMMSAHRESVLYEYCGSDQEQLTVKMVFDGYAENDQCGILAIDRFVRYLAIGIASLIHIFNPQMVILSGGISRSCEAFISSVRQSAESRLMDERMKCEIVCGQLFENAGAMGACSLALSSLPE